MADNLPLKVVFIAFGNFHFHESAGLDAFAVFDLDYAVDFRGISEGTSQSRAGRLPACPFHQHTQAPSYEAALPFPGDPFLDLQ
jgi:hypothetical protein